MDEQVKDDRLETYVQWFESSEDATIAPRKLAERDRDYYDNKQLTAEEEATLRKRGQPPIIINRIKRKIDFLKGVEQQQRTDPKAFPRNPDDERAAHAATDALRFVADNNSFDTIRSDVWENILIEGAGGCEVGVEQKRDRVEIVIRHIPWDRLFWDPYSRRADFADAMYLGMVVWVDKEEALRMYPDGADAIESTMSRASETDTYDDRPRTHWVDGKRNRIRIVQMWHRDSGAWRYCTFTRGGKLEEGESPFIDEDGEPECPLVLTSAYIDRDNNRYGVVREMIGPQDEVNKRRSKALHLLNSRQTYGNKRGVQDPRKVKAELAKPDGHIDLNEAAEFGKDFGVLPTGDMTTGHFQLLQEAKAEIDMMGPNAAMQGKSPAEQSGRAIIAQQQGGYIELGPMMDRLRQWNIRVYRAIWNRVRQFWTEERWIRVTDDERNIRFVGLNRPITAAEAYLKQLEQQGVPPEEIEAERQQLAMNPMAQQIVGVENNVAEMTVDIIVDDAPDTVTIQHEQFQEMVNLVQAGLPIPPDVLIMASQLRNKDQLLERLQAAQDPQAQQAAAEQQAQMAQLQMDELAAKIAKLVAETQKTAAQAQQIGAPEGNTGPSALEQAKGIVDMRHTEAKTAKTEAEALRTVAEMMRPALLPMPPAV